MLGTHLFEDVCYLLTTSSGLASLRIMRRDLDLKAHTRECESRHAHSSQDRLVVRRPQLQSTDQRAHRLLRDIGHVESDLVDL